jgi:hypothetical protein
MPSYLLLIEIILPSHCGRGLAAIITVFVDVKLMEETNNI